MVDDVTDSEAIDCGRDLEDFESKYKHKETGAKRELRMGKAQIETGAKGIRDWIRDTWPNMKASLPPGFVSKVHEQQLRFLFSRVAVKMYEKGEK